MPSPGLLTSFFFSESSAWASPLEENFPHDYTVWDASVLSFPNNYLVNWNPYPKGHRLETSQALRGEREENVFSVRLSRLNYRAYFSRFQKGLNPVPPGGMLSPLKH